MHQINPNLANKYYFKQNVPNFKSEQQNSYVQETIPTQNFLFPGFQQEEIEAPQIPTIQTPESQLPDLYKNPYAYDEPKTLKEKIKPYDFFGAIVPWFDHPLLMGGTTIGTFWGFNKFTNAWSGKYEESLLGKATKFGDGIAKSKFVQKDGTQRVLNFFDNGFKKIGNQLNKIQIIRAFNETPLKGEWPMAKSELISQEQRIIHEDFGSVVRQLELTSTNEIPLKNIGLKKEEEATLKRLFNVERLSEIPENKKTIAILLKRLGKSDAEALSVAGMGENAFATVKDEIRKAMGGVDADKLTKILKDESGQYVDDVLEMAKKTSGKIWVGEGEYKLLGKLQIFKRYVGMDNVENRMRSLKIGDGVETRLGKFMSQFIQKIYRGFTFGGGKLGMLIFIIPHLTHAIINTIKAERDEKIGTAVQNGIGVVSWVFTIPLATQLIYKLGGIRNAGLGKEKVAEVENLIKKYHEGSYEGTRKQLKKHIKQLSKVEDQNLITKVARKIARFFTCDLGTIKPNASENLFVKIKGNLGNFGRNVYNVPLRFLAVMGMMMALDGVINKTLSAIFGRSHDEMDVEMHKEEKKAQKQFTKDDLQARLVEANKIKIANQEGLHQLNVRNANFEQPVIDPKQFANVKNDMNFQGANVNQQVDNYNYIPNQNSQVEVKENKLEENYDNYTYIPSQDSEIKSESNEDGNVNEKKYIPAQTPVKVSEKTYDNSGLSDALKRADRAEKLAIDTLNGKFNNML